MSVTTLLLVVALVVAVLSVVQERSLAGAAVLITAIALLIPRVS